MSAWIGVGFVLFGAEVARIKRLFIFWTITRVCVNRRWIRAFRGICRIKRLFMFLTITCVCVNRRWIRVFRRPSCQNLASIHSLNNHMCVRESALDSFFSEPELPESSVYSFFSNQHVSAWIGVGFVFLGARDARIKRLFIFLTITCVSESSVYSPS